MYLLRNVNFTARNIRNVRSKDRVYPSDGMVEYKANDDTIALLKNMTLDGVRVDYVHAEQTKGAEKHVAKKTVQKAKEIKNRNSS